MLECENGAFTEYRKHPKAKGSIGTDYGLCGLNSYYHLNDIKNPMFLDFDWQLALCYKHYKAGVKFWGIYSKITGKISPAKVKKCYDLLPYKPI